MAATKAALAEGIVAGGGVTLLNISHELTNNLSEEPSFTAGKNILIKALQAPAYILLENSGIEPALWLEKIKDTKTTGMGLNVLSPKKGLVDMKKEGIIDPTRVTKEAVQNAVSIASTAATMGALVVDVPEPETPAPTGGMGGGMGF